MRLSIFCVLFFHLAIAKMKKKDKTHMLHGLRSSTHIHHGGGGEGGGGWLPFKQKNYAPPFTRFLTGGMSPL
jgi:hypothetical protein